MTTYQQKFIEDHGGPMPRLTLPKFAPVSTVARVATFTFRGVEIAIDIFMSADNDGVHWHYDFYADGVQVIYENVLDATEKEAFEEAMWSLDGISPEFEQQIELLLNRYLDELPPAA